MSDGKVIYLVPPAPTPAADVLAAAQVEGLTDVVVIGWDKNGDAYLRSSSNHAPDVLWLIEQARDATLAAGRE